MYCTVKEIIREVLDTDVPDSECVFAVVLTRGDVRHIAQDWSLTDDELEPDREVMNAERLFSTARELRDVAAGRAVLRQAGLAGGDSPARFIAPGRKYPQPYVALPAFDRNGKSAGIWLKPRCRRVCCVNHNGSGKLSGKLPGKICCRSVCSRWNGIWFVTCRKRKPWAETDTGRQTLMTTDNTNTRNDSLAARTDTWLQSLLVWSPGQRDIIKTVALVLMVLDHANRILHLDQTWMFLAGRGAFPLFALVWGLNLSRHAHIQQVAINRLWGWAVIAQFAYYLADFPWYEGNILFAFAVAAQVLTWCETRSGWRTAAAILLMALWGPLSGTSYGIAGLLMLAVSHRLYRAEDRAERLALVACLLAVIPALNLATSDAAAVAGLVMTVLTVGLVSCAGKSLPRFWPGDFFPTFYACHLAVLGVLAL